ncbi:MAG: hypothetical protein NZ919_01470 [Candidatus Caldarchaeum sp.]|nr:hypothetical protein [Candidatus Caldarchaeum sp.]
MVVGDGMTAGAVEARRFYVDVHRLAGRGRRNKPDESFHVFTADGVVFGKAERMSEIPAEAGDTVFCDVIPVELTDEFVEVLGKGVRVFYLRRLTLFKKTYERLGLKGKTARNDLRALMAVEPKWFREVSEDFLVMRRLTAAYRTLLRTHETLLSRLKALNGSERRVLLPALEAVDKQMEAMAALVEEAGKRIPDFSRVAESLGITGDNHLTAGEALAELMTYVDFNEGITDVKNYVGLFKGRPKIYSGASRKALERLTIAIKGERTIKAKDMLTTLKQIREEIRREAQKRLEVMPA